KAGRIAALAKNPKGGTAGKYDIVFDPLIFGSLIDQAGGRASAYAVETGFSPYLKKVGKKVASSAVTIYEDGSADTLARRRVDAVPVVRHRGLLDDSAGRDLPDQERRGRGRGEGHPAHGQPHQRLVQRERAQQVFGAGHVVGRGRGADDGAVCAGDPSRDHEE